MAANPGIPKPGTKLGPCKGACKHLDCANSRTMAESSCDDCLAPIGYATRFYDSPQTPGRLIHAACLEARS